MYVTLRPQQMSQLTKMVSPTELVKLEYAFMSPALSC